MSGTNKVIQSTMQKKNASESALTKALENANEEAIKDGGKKKGE